MDEDFGGWERAVKESMKVPPEELLEKYGFVVATNFGFLLLLERDDLEGIAKAVQRRYPFIDPSLFKGEELKIPKAIILWRIICALKCSLHFSPSTKEIKEGIKALRAALNGRRELIVFFSGTKIAALGEEIKRKQP